MVTYTHAADVIVYDRIRDKVSQRAFLLQQGLDVILSARNPQCAITSHRGRTVEVLLITSQFLAYLLILQELHKMVAQVIAVSSIFGLLGISCAGKISINIGLIISITQVFQMCVLRVERMLVCDDEVILQDVGIADEVSQLKRLDILCLQGVTRRVVVVNHRSILIVQRLI